MAVIRPGESTDVRPANGIAAAPQVAPCTRGARARAAAAAQASR